ncbi:winged helix-turn-helix domain-containing protein [Serratia ficaria]|uniref:winged helix-turn-helix domain-containing protein n=1 Tax=Serratia ficaria TaxID=61651 RepID=UPI0021C8688D|nr:helix-turn-helix domain-containing protein [Serratia ficaria]
MQCSDKYGFLENETLSISLEKRVLFLKEEEMAISLTVLQSRMIFFLLSGVTKKGELIEKVWPDKHVAITDNNYHQLVYQCRALFTAHGLPAEVIRTVHRHGVMFDLTILEEHYVANSVLVDNSEDTGFLNVTKNRLMYMCGGGIILPFLILIFSVAE